MSSSTGLDFSQRVAPRDLPELMDEPCSYEEFRDCLHSLEQVNRWFLGYRPTLAWLDELLNHLAPRTSEPLHILDVGSGGGDLLRRIAHWASERGVAIKLTGIDMNPHAARAAMESTPQEMHIEWVTGDALAYVPESPVDVMVSSLTAHHLEDEEIVTLLRWMDRTARRGWFISDLERSEQSYRLFGWAARLVGWHRFVQHDGPVSFRRALREQDWERLLARAEIPQSEVTLERWRPGRLCVGRRR